jgi:heptaprenylglyceryl phosphate synthase
MPRSAFTARPDQVVFYLLLSGNERTVSAGVQRAVRRLVESNDPEAAALYEQAKWMTKQAEAELEAGKTVGEEVKQEEILRHVLEHHLRLVALWENREGNG